MSSHLQIPYDAVYVYRAPNGTVLFRRLDHKAPSHLDVRHLVGMAWTEDDQPRSVSIKVAGITPADVDEALAWRKHNHAPVEPALEMLPIQRSAFDELVRHQVATLTYMTGMGAYPVVAAAAHHVAARSDSPNIDIVASHTFFEGTRGHFGDARDASGVNTRRRWSRTVGNDWLSDDTAVAVVYLPDLPAIGGRTGRDLTTAENRLRTISDALSKIISRGGTVYFLGTPRDGDVSGLRVTPGVTSAGSSPTRDAMETALRLYKS